MKRTTDDKKKKPAPPRGARRKRYVPPRIAQARVFEHLALACVPGSEGCQPGVSD